MRVNRGSENWRVYAQARPSIIFVPKGVVDNISLGFKKTGQTSYCSRLAEVTDPGAAIVTIEVDDPGALMVTEGVGFGDLAEG